MADAPNSGAIRAWKECPLFFHPSVYFFLEPHIEAEVRRASVTSDKSGV